MRNTLVVAMLAACAGGCSPDEAEAGRGREAHAESDAASAEWVSTASGGIEVRVRPNRFPVEVGAIEFHITLDRPVPEGTPVSIDIVSPEMPAMGILRYPATELGPRTYVAQAEIAMDGAWEVYVNLGDGTDAASFEFDVAPAGTSGHDHSGAVSEEHEGHGEGAEGH